MLAVLPRRIAVSFPHAPARRARLHHQVTAAEAFDALALKGPVTAYIGFDATVPSLHVGSLVQIIVLRRLQQSGHRADRAHGRRDNQTAKPASQCGS
jgi:tyrosyl-tRNA synthetase